MSLTNYNVSYKYRVSTYSLKTDFAITLYIDIYTHSYINISFWKIIPVDSRRAIESSTDFWLNMRPCITFYIPR